MKQEGSAGADIQYTEVMEFDVAAIMSALFTLEMPMLVEMEVYEELSA